MKQRHKNITERVSCVGFNPLKNIAESTEEASVELFGNGRMIVFDCKCVVDYTSEYIVLNLGKFNMKIRGDSLSLSSFSYGQTDICGEIIGIEFEKIN